MKRRYMLTLLTALSITVGLSPAVAQTSNPAEDTIVTSVTSEEPGEENTMFSASASESSHFTTEISADGIIITGLTDSGRESISTDKTVSIPETIDGQTVTSISDRAFAGLGLTHAVIPDSIISIGVNAFQGNALTEVSTAATDIKENAFAQNKITSVTLPNIVTIGNNAFRDNAISRINLGSLLESIGDGAFLNNKIVSLVLPDTIKSIGVEAFSINQIREISLPNSIESLGDNVFSRNDSWVKILTDSPSVATTKYDSGYGHVVNPVTVNVQFVDTDGADIMSPEIIGDDLSDENNVFGLNQESSYSPPEVNGYQMVTVSPIIFTPDRDGYEIRVEYRKVNNDPVITLPSTSKKFDANQVVTEADLLSGVTARDYNQRDITSSLTVEPKTIDTSIPGLHAVYYTATDANGNTATVKSYVLVGQDWAKLEVGGGWLVEDFTYNEVNVTGFSPSGSAKFAAGNTEVHMPTHNTNGQEVTSVGSSAFNSKMTGGSIGSWGNITNISNSAFSNNQLTALTDSWGNVTSIGASSFQNNQLTALPDSWGDVTSIGNSAFSNNQLTALPDSWSNVTSISNSAFSSNKLTTLPDSWGNVTSIGASSFQNNQLTALPDSWGNVTSIGASSFQNNQLTALPDSWGDVTSIGNSAFSRNNLTALPDSWSNVTSIGSSAFSINQLTALPDSWGNITSIGSSAFSGNNLTALPDSWDDVTSIGSSAFSGNNLTALPDSWDDVTSIGSSAFSRNNLTALPDSWSNVTSIGSSAFSRNNLTALPDSWSNVTSIGANAFQNNQLTALPDSWGNVTSIGNSVFSINQLTALPDSWGNVTSIGDNAFSINKLTALPDSWGNITSIGGGAFRDNQLTALPDSWGNVTSISSGAFQTNQLTALPDSWGNVTSISSGAFSRNNLTTLPDSWGNITSIGANAFYNNQLTALPDSWSNVTSIGDSAFYNNPNTIETRIFTVPDGNLTTTFYSQINSSSIPKTSDNPIYLITENRTNPNNVVSTRSDIIINPTQINVTYVDENGEELSPPESIIAHGQDSYEVTVDPIYGYHTPESVILTLDQGVVNHQFVYRRMTEEELLAAKNSNISISTGDRNYYIGDMMNGIVRIDRSGYDTTDIVNPIIRVDLPSEYFTNNVEVTNIPGLSTSNLQVHDGYFTFQYDGTISGGTTVEIPFLVQFRKYATPENTPISVRATLVDGSNAVAQSNESSYVGYYNNPYMTVTANGSMVNGAIPNYDQTVVSNENPPVSHVAVDGNNYITYNIVVSRLDRNVSEYVYQVQLPTYRVHPDSGVESDENGRALAVFNPELNPGWVLSEDGMTLSYAGDNGGKTSSPRHQLVLNYPGAEESSNIPLSASSVLTPTNMPPTEDVMTVGSGITNSFYRTVIPPGEIFIKNASAPQERGIFFYDNAYSKSKDFGWYLSYRAPESGDLTNVVLTDNDLDDRMYYSHAVLPTGKGPIVVTAMDDSGATLFTERFDNGGTVTLPDNVKYDTDSLVFRLENPVRAGDSGSIMMYTKIRNIDEVSFDSTPGSEANKFHNNLDFSSDQVNGSWGADKVLRARNQVIQATKSSSFGGDTITGQDGVYTVGFYARAGFGDTITNFEQVDLIPRGLEVNGYSMSSSFARIPGAQVRLEQNYNNSGQDAVIWTAPEIPYNYVTPDTIFTVGSVTTWIGMEVVDGTMTNDVFVRAQETGLANVVQDDRLAPGEWSKASVSTDVAAAAVMVQRKNIRTYDDNDVAGPWVTETTTTPGQKMDYRLRVTNGTDLDRTGVNIYDVLPIVGDLGLTGLVEQSRESEFANELDLSRDIIVPDGMRVQYYNSDSPVPGYHLGNATDIIPELEWSDSPADNTKAIRVIPEEGTVFTLGARTSIDVIIPMVANNETNGYPGVPSDNTIDKTAWNSFYYLDDAQPRLIEGNRVSNTMVREPITVEFLKTGLTGPLSGATFEYQREDGTVVMTTRSDSEGMVRFTNIYAEEGDRIVETAAPTGYQVSNEIREITDETLMDYYTSGGDGVLELPEFRNRIPWVPLQPLTGDLEFTKVDINGEPLSGITFQLTRTWEYNGTTFNALYEARSNADGVVSFKNVTPAANYTLTEISAPGQLKVIDPITNVTVKGRTTSYVGSPYEGVENAVVNDKVSMRINKIGVNEDMLVDGEGNLRAFGEFSAIDGGRLAGAVLDIVNVETEEVVGTVTTTTGNDVVDNLEPGVLYRVVERTEPENWDTVEGLDMVFQINARGMFASADGTVFPVQTALFVPNEREEKLSTINVRKTGAGQPLAEAVFRLERNVDGVWEQVSEEATNIDGVVSWMDLPHGDYRVSEVSAPDGFNRTFDTRKFTLPRYDSRTFTWNVNNIESNPVINKVEYLARGLSSRDAAESLIVELGNPDGAEVISNGNTFDVIIRLANATFELRDNPQGAALEVITTGDNGLGVITTDLDENATYYLVETAAPEGYRTISDPVQFRIIDHARVAGYNGTINIMVNNNRDLGRLVISKLDDGTGQPLEGSSAQFRLEKLTPVTDGESVGDYNGVSYQIEEVVDDNIVTSSDNGLVVVDGLPFGVYRVIETDAPEGYVLDSTPRIFEVNRDEATFTHLFTNIPEIPEINVVKTINGHDANNEMTAVWLPRDNDTMEVSFTVTNTGTVPLRNVTLRDVTEGDNPEMINDLIRNANVTVTNNVNDRWDTTDGEFANGSFTLVPGGTATLTVTAPSPAVGDMHKNTVTAVGYNVFNDAPVEDDDPAHAYRVNVGFPLPHTGDQALVMIGVVLMLVIGSIIGVEYWRRRKA